MVKVKQAQAPLRRVPQVKGSDNPLTHIIIKGARVHNLKNVSLALPRNKLIVITGLSGSGKSSLAFDTLYAEGQRRYVESLSSYARQFLGRLDKPDVDSITGISPAVAIEQKVTSRSSRSTVGTSTEIYDYLKLLFARVGRTFSPVSGREVKRHGPADVLEWVLTHDASVRFYLLAPVVSEKGSDPSKKLAALVQQGFSRVFVNGALHEIEQVGKLKVTDKLEILIDRFSADPEDDNRIRITDSAESAFFEGHGWCILENAESGERHHFSNRFEADGITFEEPSVNLFAFNNPVGACKTCEGFGSVIGIDENLVVPNKKLSIYQDAVACWRGEKMSEWKDELVMNAGRFGFPVHKPWSQLTAAQRQLVWEGNKYFKGLHRFFKYLESESYKIQYRVMLSRYRGKTTCPECHGTRLRKDANYVKVGGKSISELVTCSVHEALEFFNELKLSPLELKVASRLLTEIRSRLGFLVQVGLGYLTLNRLSNTLSGGESQRINLATSLGSALVGSIYILDEPSIGLHPRDTQRLIGVLRELQRQGNTVIVVEHDEEIMRAADMIVDMGPEAGTKGGEVVFAGTLEGLMQCDHSLTAQYLTGQLKADTGKRQKPGRDKLVIRGARANNLKDVNVEIPLRCFTAISGVSGSGKSSLVKHILFPALQKELTGFTASQLGEFDGLEGDIRTLHAVEWVDQNPIGKSSRSNPVTYVKAYDEIRQLFADQPLSRQRGLRPGHFSFNTEGGRCEACEGEGVQTISMQFMADVHLVCDVCKGKRFQDEVLEVLFHGKNISEILNLTVDNAIAFFSEREKSTTIKNLLLKLEPLQQVGLGYITLGQSSSTLSGGEAQRIKLASFLGKGGSDKHTLFIFDEPTTGLHFHDVYKLMHSFRLLLQRGHSLLAIEHNPDVLRQADWLIDLGPEGGDDGGRVLYSGPPEGITKQKDSYTAAFIKPR